MTTDIESLKRALQSDLDDIEFRSLDPFIRAAGVFQVGRCKLAAHGIGALDCVLKVCGAWWIARKPVNEGSELVAEAHEQCRLAIVNFLRNEARQIAATARGGS